MRGFAQAVVTSDGVVRAIVELKRRGGPKKISQLQQHLILFACLRSGDRQHDQGHAAAHTSFNVPFIMSSHADFRCTLVPFYILGKAVTNALLNLVGMPDLEVDKIVPCLPFEALKIVVMSSLHCQSG